MRIIMSPTKKMRIDDSLTFPLSTPVYLEKTKVLMDYLKEKSLDELQGLFECNEKIAMQNYMRFQEMDLEKQSSVALLSYDGIAFQYMAPQIFTQEYFEYVNQHLRIISAFYGVLKPFDAITPYRLEMQTKLSAPFAKTLYEYWESDLYNEVIDDSHLILNLASNEYSKSIKPYLKDSDIWIDVVFGELKNNKIVEKGVYVKMARGEMVRYMAENKIEDVREIRNFNRLGFVYNKDLSTEYKYVFIKENQNGESN